MPPQLFLPAQLSGFLVEAAVMAARTSRDALRKPVRKGRTLRPGPDTPLWNGLVVNLLAQFKRRGERAHLARILGLPRQRVTEMLRRQHHLPDAERALLLLVWLHARREGRDLG